MNNRDPFPDIRHLSGGHVVYLHDDQEFDRVTVTNAYVDGGKEYRIRDTAGRLIETAKTEADAVIAAHMHLVARFRSLDHS